ncbi:MAG: hypothetical protein HGA97_01375 [Chlorobiaceae bacterium]|nr:hypothetical protein [Chlorobiaceae bacterium]
MNARFSFRVVAAFLALIAGTVFNHDMVSAVLRPSDVTVSARPDSLLAGERLHYVITVYHEGPEQLSIASLATGQGTPFEIISTKSNSKKLSDGRVEYRMDTELAVFGLGRKPLPRFTVLSGKGAVSERARFDVVPTESVTVLSASDSTITELRPIVPALKAPLPAWLLVPVLLVLLVLLLVGSFVRSLFITLRRHLDDPVRVARKKLRSIRRQLSKGLSPDLAYESLSNILREFLQKRYQFGAREMVTQEIAEVLASRKINIREGLLKLLDQADLVKFADSRPGIDECRRSLRVAEVLVANSTEPEEPEFVDQEE